MVRYPADQRRSLGDLENMRIRTPDGGEVPFSAGRRRSSPGRGFASIKRVDRNRAVNVTAAVDETVTSSGTVVADLQTRGSCPRDAAAVPRRVLCLRRRAGGAGGRQSRGLQAGFVIAVLAIFALLAVPLKSYLQPLIIMSAIPFGLVGAVWGHIRHGPRT